MKKKLIGIITPCMRCGKRTAKWVVFNFFYCDDCVNKV